jgi:hypothetical protein
VTNFSNSPRLLTEAAIFMIQDRIKSEITLALSKVRTYYHDGQVTTESPSNESYFIYPKAQGYRCPAIYVEDAGFDFRQGETKANFVNAKASINVSFKVEDKDQYKLTLKCFRYISAMHQILEQANIVNADKSVKLVVQVKSVKPGPMYTLTESEPDSTAQFFKEYVFYCDVDFYENL